MPIVSKLGNGNIMVLREPGEEKLTAEELHKKAAPTLGTKLGNGNVYILPAKPAGSEGLEAAAAGEPNPDFDPEARKRELERDPELQELLDELEQDLSEGVEASVQTSTEEPPAPALEPWTLSLTPATYLRRYGVWAAHSERALAHMKISREAYCELLGIKMPPKPETEEPAAATAEASAE